MSHFYFKSISVLRCYSTILKANYSIELFEVIDSERIFPYRKHLAFKDFKIF